MHSVSAEENPIVFRKGRWEFEFEKADVIVTAARDIRLSEVRGPFERLVLDERERKERAVLLGGGPRVR